MSTSPQPSTARKRPVIYRDRRGRGMRGPLAPDSTPISTSRAERFDDIVLATVERLERRWREQLAVVEFAVEDVPSLEDWEHDWVPMARAYAAEGALPARIVVYRRPIETRAKGRSALRAMVADVVIDQVAELLGVEPEEIDPHQH